MSIAEGLLPEFDQEMATTRQLLARVPSDKGPWKPHPKSFPLGHLAQLVATMPGWLTQTLRKTDIDLTTSPAYSFETTDTLLGEFDRHVRQAHEALALASGLVHMEGSPSTAQCRAALHRRVPHSAAVDRPRPALAAPC